MTYVNTFCYNLILNCKVVLISNFILNFISNTTLPFNFFPWNLKSSVLEGQTARVARKIQYKEQYILFIEPLGSSLKYSWNAINQESVIFIPLALSPKIITRCAKVLPKWYELYVCNTTIIWVYIGFKWNVIYTKIY